VEQINYISGDTWNVNPIALQRVESLFCKNERAVIRWSALSDAVHSGGRIRMGEALMRIDRIGAGG
jgi:hypothetical protein